MAINLNAGEQMKRRAQILKELELLFGGAEELDRKLEWELDQAKSRHTSFSTVVRGPSFSTSPSSQSDGPLLSLYERLFANVDTERLASGNFDVRCDMPPRTDSEFRKHLLSIKDCTDSFVP